MLIAIIQARMSSTRLPGKTLKPLLGKPVLWHVVNRVSRAKLIDFVAVATTTNNSDDTLAEFCNGNNIACFRGSENDVLDRYYQCAKKYNATDIVRITADCPLHDPNIIDAVIREYSAGNYDYVNNEAGINLPDGTDTEVFKFDALKSAWENAELISEREHVTPYIKKCNKFNQKTVRLEKLYPPYRLTIDNPEDYEFITKIYDGIGRDLFYLDEIVEYLKKNPKLLQINQHIIMNEGYLKSLEEDKKNLARMKLKNSNLIIEGEGIFLRKLRVEDASVNYCNWLKDPCVNRFLETRDATIDGLKLYINEKANSETCLFLGIFTQTENKHIGNIKLEPIDFENKKATLGLLIGDMAYWGKGICTKVVKLVVDYSFKNLNLNRVELGVISDNLAAIRCYTKVGFKIDKTIEIPGLSGSKQRKSILMSIDRS
jgi:spore coat polysaccharide biosynthesis protein SpsF (cytidylyltransferase family)/RimJ/RimL family protein N-acetyltransferase